MRLQHAKQAAGGLPADGPDRAQARAAITAEVERLRWRTWNGKAKDARITLERIHALLPSFEGEPAQAAAGAGGGGPLPALPERPSGRLRRTAPGRPAGRDVIDRGHGQFPGQPAHGQVAADALVPTRGRPAAPSPLRRLQRHARHRLRAALPIRIRQQLSQHDPQSRDSPGDGAYDRDDVYAEVAVRYPAAAVVVPPRECGAERSRTDRADAARPASTM